MKTLDITENEFLYLDGVYFDLSLNENGDLDLDVDGDLQLCSDIKLKSQTARNIIKSITKNWFYDNIGADLEQLYGKPIDFALQEGLNLLQNGFKKYNLFSESEFYIKAIKRNNYEALFVIILQIDLNIIPMDVILNITGKISINWDDDQI